MPLHPILVEISAGELIDKITILEIKQERLSDNGKLQNVNKELGALLAVRAEIIPQSDELDSLAGRLKELNLIIWNTEDIMRDLEKKSDFGQKFVALARTAYQTNDLRSAVKRRINSLLGSRLVEEKHYLTD